MFRVITYNIRAGLGQDGVRSIRRIADLLASFSPDIVCLQEVDQRVLRSWLSNQPKYLSMRLNMQAVFQRNLKFGVGGFGNCVLAKSSVQHCRCHPLPGDGEPRGLIEVNTLIDGRELTVFSTHLAIEKNVRKMQAKAVSDIVRSSEGPKILCGDMNDVRGSETLTALLHEAVMRDTAMEMDAGSIPTKHGDTRHIDFVLAALELDVKSYQVVGSDASDHFPVVVDLEFA
ncbi:MAG: endonuclease/exonuclease/phosphatase family protein [Armatimonadota bacterium]